MKEFVKNIKAMFADAFAFVTDPNARTISRFTYPNGNAMSVRDAKKKGLIS